MSKRVAITGVGVVSPVGIGAEPFWDGLMNGRSAVDVIRRYDASALSSRNDDPTRASRPFDRLSLIHI